MHTINRENENKLRGQSYRGLLFQPPLLSMPIYGGNKFLYTHMVRQTSRENENWGPLDC